MVEIQQEEEVTMAIDLRRTKDYIGPRNYTQETKRHLNLIRAKKLIDSPPQQDNTKKAGNHT